MILYNITVNLDKEAEQEWLAWMKTQHIPDMLATGLFLENKIFRLLNETENEGSTFSVQYFAKNLDDIESYINLHSQKLQSEHAKRFEGRFVAFRTLLEGV